MSHHNQKVFLLFLKVTNLKLLQVQLQVSSQQIAILYPEKKHDVGNLNVFNRIEQTTVLLPKK